MLPHQELQVHYEDVVWLYVCRTWDEDEKDLEAARIHDRFGITSWPHLYVIDPRDDSVLARAGRSPPAIRRALASAVDAVEVLGDKDLAWELALLEDPVEGKSATLDDRLVDPSPHTRIRAVEELARLGDEGDTPERRAGLLRLLQDPDEDIVVRFRVLSYLLPRAPASVLSHAGALLLTPHDPFRFALLDALAGTPGPEHTPVLVRLFAEAGGEIASNNPNVLRMRAAKALAAGGDARAIDALAPVARTADARNVTTRMAVEALGAIAERGDDEARHRVRQILRASLPVALGGGQGDEPSREERYALRLVEAVAAAWVHARAPDAGSAMPDVPKRWRPRDREAYLSVFGATPPPEK